MNRAVREALVLAGAGLAIGFGWNAARDEPLPLSGSLDFLHDSVITGRKFYSLAELELIARLAAPGARVEVRAAQPGYSVLTVRAS